MTNTKDDVLETSMNGNSIPREEPEEDGGIVVNFLDNHLEEIKNYGDVQVARPLYIQEHLNQVSDYEKPSKNLKNAVKDKLTSFTFKSCLFDTVPILKWLPHYNCRKNIIGDILSGITVAIMHIPQGMAYGMLGNVPPVIGIYMAFFPVLVYFFFGTSRHVSMGTFAIVCLMTGKVVSKYVEVDSTILNTTTVLNDTSLPHYTPIQVATTVTFTVAIFQMLMYLLRLGIVTTLLSETLVSGFTCASAFHVVASQVKDLLGLSIQKRRGLFSFVYTIYDSVLAIPQANRAAVSISMVSIVLMVINNDIFKPWLSTKTIIPFPIELAAVVIGTSVSYIFDFNTNYNITIIGDIPTGLPAPFLPQFSLIPSILADSLVITIISYSITMSMALIFAQKCHYEVNANQELLALSFSNICGSFFSCLPVTASLSRSMIQQVVGGVTQIASVVSCLILLVVLLWMGPLFQTLPRCVLASIIVVALKGMLLQYLSLSKFWRLSKWDALVWLVTFFTTVLIGIDVGLAAGFLVSLLSIFMRGHVPYTCLLGVMDNTDLYLDCKRYKGVREIEGIKIFHYCGALNFASKFTFKNLLFKRVGFDPLSVLAKRKKLEDSTVSVENGELLTKCIIVDFSALTYIDPSGVELMRQLTNEYEQLNIAFYITCCSGPVYEMLVRCFKYENRKEKLNIYPTLHDAVTFAKLNILKNKYV